MCPTQHASCFHCGDTTHYQNKCLHYVKRNYHVKLSQNSNYENNSSDNLVKEENFISSVEEMFLDDQNIVETDKENVTVNRINTNRKFKDEHYFIVDSGATRHVTSNRNLLTNIKKLENPVQISYLLKKLVI